MTESINLADNRSNENLMPVHYYPCGHVGKMTREQISVILSDMVPGSLFAELFGKTQIKDIDSRTQLDAAILPCTSCPDCEYSREKRDSQYGALFI